MLIERHFQLGQEATTDTGPPAYHLREAYSSIVARVNFAWAPFAFEARVKALPLTALLSSGLLACTT